MLQHKRRLFLFITAFITLVLSFTAYAAAPLPMTGTAGTTPTTFDLRFMSMLRQWGIPGATIAVMKHGRLIAAKGYGWSSVNPRVPMQANTTFRIASVSKTITSVAVLKLVQDNRIRLDDRAFDILNDFRPLHGGSINPKLYEITIRDLLNMSSGWYTEGPGHLDPLFGPWSHHVTSQLGNTPPTCVAATRLMMGRHLEFTPGTASSYSNFNYCMLGLIISKVTQNNYSSASYANFVRNQIFIPADMTNTQLGSTALAKHRPNETRYFDADPGRTNVDGLPYSNSSIIEKNYADGGWTSSAVDLAKFLQALAAHKILTQNTIRVMLTRPSFLSNPFHYLAMGWTVRRSDGHWYWSKHGSFTGTTAQIIQRDDGTSYVALFNTEPAGKVRFFEQVKRVLTSYPVS